MEPGDTVSPSTFHGSSKKAVRDSPHPGCDREVGVWAIILLPQRLRDALELGKDWKVKSGKPLPKYGNSSPFSACTGSYEGKV